MDNRSWDSNAQPAPPTPPASPSIGYPNNGNPVTPTPPTYPGAYWFYQLGEELRAILTAAGITPNAATLNQLLLALRSPGVFTTPAVGDRTTKAATMACFSQEFSGSLAPNSHQRFPTGLIIQWGSVVVGAGTDQVAVSGTFPISFPNACFVVTGTTDGAGDFLAAVTFTLSNFSGTVYDRLAGANPVAGNLKYFAIGY